MEAVLLLPHPPFTASEVSHHSLILALPAHSPATSALVPNYSIRVGGPRHESW